MTNIQIFSLIIVIITTLTNILLIVRQNKFNRRLDDYYIKIGKSKDIIDILETRIEDVLNTYILMNLAYKDSLYISMEMQETITKEIYNQVILSLPAEYIMIFKMLYDRPFDEIKRRVTLAVMAYVIETNGNYKE